MGTNNKLVGFEGLIIAKVVDPKQKEFDYIITYSRSGADNHSVGINVSPEGDVLDYGEFAPGNFNMIRRAVNNIVKTMAQDNYVDFIKLEKNYQSGVYVSVRAASGNELNLTHVYNKGDEQWYSENSNPAFSMVPTDHYITKYEDSVITLACWMYNAKELENDVQKKIGGERE